MMSLNPFVENNKTRINQFLNGLCEVGDFYDQLEVRIISAYACLAQGFTRAGIQIDQYMALSKKDLTINITLNELYNTHALLEQHIETLVSILLRHSWISVFTSI